MIGLRLEHEVPARDRGERHHRGVPLCAGCHEHVSEATGWRLSRERHPCVRCGDPTAHRAYLVRQ